MKKNKFNKARTLRSLDRIFSAIILHKYNRTCQICNSQRLCNTAHIQPKEFTSLRYNENNVLCLCVSCHKFGRNSFHQNPLWFADWYYKRYGVKAADELLRLAGLPYEFTEETADEIRKRLMKQFS